MNYITIVVKYGVYKEKWKQHIPTMSDIKRVLQNYMKTEIFIGATTDTVEMVADLQ